jgi:CheY-like chemotaxis protein
MEIAMEESLKYSKKLDILYAEDDQSIIDEYKTIFEEFFNSVEITYNGEEALDKYKEFYKTNGRFYDIVITDLNMPNIDGHQLINNMQELNRNQIVIVISAYGEKERLVELLNQGVHGFLSKPISLNSLVNAIEKTSKHAYFNRFEDEI